MNVLVKKVVKILNEIWKKIKGFEDYSVSNLGRIKSFKLNKNGTILKPRLNTKNGYLRIGLSMNNKRYNKLIHVLVYETFNEYNLKISESVHHIDENKINNNLPNLKKFNKFDHISYHKKGKKLSENHKNKISKNNGHGMLNKKHLDETKFKMSQIAKNRIPKKGEDIGTSKLKENDIIEIKYLLKFTKYTLKKISRIYNVGLSTIYDIKSEKTWKHVKF